jgi:hypothetical protein
LLAVADEVTQGVGVSDDYRATPYNALALDATIIFAEVHVSE